jgi:hypothetical protein
MNQARAGSSYSKQRKLGYPILETRASGFVGTDDSQGYCWTLTRYFSSDQVTSRSRRGENHVNLGGWGGCYKI